jgi:toxin-antitoxin system PIN domain toxin
MMSIPDINVLLYAVDNTSLSHEPCFQWLNAALNSDEQVGFTWHVITGFVRLSTNPKVAQHPLTTSQAFSYVESWLSRPRTLILVPKQNHLATFRGFLEKAGTAGNLTSDAHLAAFAVDYHGEIISCDSDFAQFPGLKWFNPINKQRVNS